MLELVSADAWETVSVDSEAERGWAPHIATGFELEAVDLLSVLDSDTTLFRGLTVNPLLEYGGSDSTFDLVLVSDEFGSWQ